MYLVLAIVLTYLCNSWLLTSGILFSTVVNAVFVAKLVTSGVLFSTVVIEVFVIKLLISGIFPSILAILES